MRLWRAESRIHFGIERRDISQIPQLAPHLLLVEKGTGHHLGPNLVVLRGHGSNSSASPPGDRRAPRRPGCPRRAGSPSGRRGAWCPECIQPRRARHPDPQHRAREIINQGIRLHGISTWRTDCQEFESRTKQIKALAFKRCPVPFSFEPLDDRADVLVRVVRGWSWSGATFPESIWRSGPEGP